jgi:hypothetical protein
MKFNIRGVNGSLKAIEFTPIHIINAGYTGRNQTAVQAHIDELRKEGIPAPDKTPTYFVKFIDKMTQNESFEVLDETDHSGEGEFVLLFEKNQIYVGVGSDHTDRKLEIIDIPKAKQIYPNTISKDLWNLSDVINHWDEIILRSWVSLDGKKTLFQESALSAMLDANDLIKRVQELLVDPLNTQGLVIYSGTVASLFSLSYSSYFETELDDPVQNRKITSKYNMKCVSRWYKYN